MTDGSEERQGVSCRGYPNSNTKPQWVISYTAHAQQEDRRNFIASGFDEILIKPVSSEKLANAVAAVMRNRGGTL